MKRPSAREHFVEHRTEREDVGPLVRRLPLDLLRGHVTGRAEHHARLGELRHRLDVALLFLRAAGRVQLRQAEVQDLHVTIHRHEHVLGFQIPVDDPCRMSRSQAVGDLDGKVDGLASRKRSLESLAQRLTMKKLEDDVRSAVVQARVEDGQEVRVIERARRLALLLEAPQSI